jgi:hypothetical protein
MNFLPALTRRTALSRPVLLFFLSLLLFAAPLPASGEEPVPAKKQNRETPAEDFQRVQLVFEPDAYYTNLALILSLTKAPIPQLGELTEGEIYYTLLSQAALLPQFMVFEVSVNPLPYAGTYIKEHNRDLYDDAQISGSFNWIKALTAGFEEPYAASILAGNVANFVIPGVADIKGLGYSGYLVSAGNYHIKDNELIKDKWWELEWKLKGDRKSPVKKLSWSFRIGAKLHGNPDITDIIYLSARRSRVDYKPKEHSLFNNSGFEYTFDMDSRTFSAIRHYFFVDKKWPLQGRQIALSLALGFVWESAKKYTGALAPEGGKDNFQFILRPNIEF